MHYSLGIVVKNKPLPNCRLTGRVQHLFTIPQLELATAKRADGTVSHKTIEVTHIELRNNTGVAVNFPSKESFRRCCNHTTPFRLQLYGTYLIEGERHPTVYASSVQINEIKLF
jgi:hypothetical protein